MRRVITLVVDTAIALRIVTGAGEPRLGAHTRLAIRIVDIARDLGFRSVSLRSSHYRISNSRYIGATDAQGRTWEIRVANHQRPERSSIPHLDLISVDGETGLDDARDFLSLVAAGSVPWFDSTATASPVSQPARKRINRCR